MPTLDEQQVWSQSVADVLKQLGTDKRGLDPVEAAKRVEQYQSSRIGQRKQAGDLGLFFGQFNSPIIWLLLFAAFLSLYFGEAADAVIIFIIVFLSGLLGFYQERGAAGAMAKLIAIVQVHADVKRGSKSLEIPLEEVVPGDILELNAGDLIPGDSRILEARNLFVDESSLTGESFPVDKQAAALPGDTPVAKRTNMLFLGTHVVNGTGLAVVVSVGVDTEFGKVSETLRFRPPETEFEHGIRQFGAMLMQVTLLLVIAILAINVYLHRPVVDSLLFALAIAVGLTPQLLPAIISINLSHGARKMAGLKVIVKRLATIQNLGSMDVLSTDKTGTLTEGTVRLDSAIGLDGELSDEVLKAATLNSNFQSGYANPIDEAIRTASQINVSDFRKVDEKPYDFTRKCLSVLVASSQSQSVVTKGALKEILAVCSYAKQADGKSVPIKDAQQAIGELFRSASEKGFRTLGVAIRDAPGVTKLTDDLEKDMTFLGLVLLEDPLKEGIVEAIAKLKALGITLKVISGDNRLVAASVAAKAGLHGTVLTGSEVQALGDLALARKVVHTDVFAEIEPNQKEHIIRALRRAGHVVGYMGDGINDAPALHAADAGISVSNAVDVAKQAADIVLLEKDLNVLCDGVEEGRITFTNTLKYVFMATSANFGNMFSMAGISLFLPFLPLLPKQILLANLMTDMPEMSIAGDNVDAEVVRQPHRWDIGFIRRFMVVFGLISSLGDYATFYVLLHLMGAGSTTFRTGWFIESVVTAALIVLVVRTHLPFWKSRPSTPLLLSTLLSVVAVLIIPYSPLASPLGLEPIPLRFLLALAIITAGYAAMAETAKHYFYRSEGKRMDWRGAQRA